MLGFNAIVSRIRKVKAMPERENGKDFGFDALSKSLEGQLSGSKENKKATGSVEELTNSDVIDTVRTSSTSIVLFYRDDCPFCERLLPILDDLAEDYKSRVAFAKVNIDRVVQARDEFNVLGVPLVIAFKKGMSVGRIEGLRPIDEYDTWIDSIHSGLKPMGMDDGPATSLE
jgi:thioredoxin-like negative regulator of GroEL